MIQLRPIAVSLTLLAGGLLGAAPMAWAADATSQASGVGTTFPEPAYVQWARLFAGETGEHIVYDGAGSGAGVTAMKSAGPTFGATDAPLDAADLTTYDLFQFPTLIGGVVPVLNLPGVAPGELVLDGRTLADLFMGRIAFWDDPAILARNPHLPLPHLAVASVRRSDASGTTAAFAAYLAIASRGWDEWLGQTPPILRPVGLAAEGSEGMATTVAVTPGAIGYIGFDFAQAKHMTYPDLVNGAGRVVQPTLASIAAAAADADWSHGLTPSLIAQPGGASWPIVSATYVLMRRGHLDDAVQVALRFFAWAQRSGGPVAEDLGFVPLPPSAALEVDRMWDAMTDTTVHTIVRKTTVIR